MLKHDSKNQLQAYTQACIYQSDYYIQHLQDKTTEIYAFVLIVSLC